MRHSNQGRRWNPRDKRENFHGNVEHAPIARVLQVNLEPDSKGRSTTRNTTQKNKVPTGPQSDKIDHAELSVLLL